MYSDPCRPKFQMDCWCYLGVGRYVRFSNKLYSLDVQEMTELETLEAHLAEAEANLERMNQVVVDLKIEIAILKAEN